MTRLPLFVDCATCEALNGCRAAYGDHRCWDRSSYPAEAIHPDDFASSSSDPFAIAPAAQWGRVEVHSWTLPVVAELRAPPLVSYGLSLRATKAYLRSAAPTVEPCALFTFGADARLETLWRDRRRFQPGSAVPLVAPSFSTWSDRPPFEHLFESARTAELARILARSGPVVPSIPLSQHVKPEWWLEFLSPGQPRDIAVDLATKVGGDWPLKLRVLRHLRDAIGPLGCRLIAYGVSSVGRLTSILQLWGNNVLFTSAGIVHAALAGGKLVQAHDLSAATDLEYGHRELIRLNADAYEAAVANLPIVAP